MIFGLDPLLASTAFDSTFTLIFFWAEAVAEKARSINPAAKMLRIIFFIFLVLNFVNLIGINVMSRYV